MILNKWFLLNELTKIKKNVVSLFADIKNFCFFVKKIPTR